MTTEITLIKNALSKNDRISKQEDEPLKVFIATQIQSVFLFAGQQPAKKDVLIICREILRDLKTRYKFLTLKEVELCLNNGVKGEYGNYYGINVATIANWLRIYYNSDERRKAQQEKMFADLPALPERTELTQEEKDNMLYESYKSALSDAMSGKYINDHGNAIYNFLDRNGEFDFSKEEKWQFMEMAEKELEVEAKERERQSGCPRPIATVLAEITEKGIKSRAKRIALNVYFSRLKQKKE